MIFVDTRAWFASIITTDPNHTIAAAWLSSNPAPLLATDYAVDETLTLLQARHHHTKARPSRLSLLSATSVLML